jgi:FixJ family two-component response regulator
VFVVDDQSTLLKSLTFLLRSEGFATEPYDSAAAFLDGYDPERPGCLLLDLQMPDMDGLQLLERLAAKGDCRPVIILTGHGDVGSAVRAMKAGAVDFLLKPFQREALLERIRHAVGLDAEWRRWHREARDVIARLDRLSPREREVMDLVIDGRSTREIAAHLSLAVKTVESLRHAVMDKMQAHSAVELTRLVDLCRAPYGTVAAA